MMVTLTRVYRFVSSHRLHAPSLSSEQNAAIYGKCNNPFGHGHNYVLQVSVRGPVDPATGRVVNLQRLDEFVQRAVVHPFDHRNLNEEVLEFSSLVPTTENLALVIAGRLRAAWREVFPQNLPHLDKVRIYETERNIFELPV